VALLQSNAVEVSQGDVVIATSTGMAAKADDLTITPVAQKPSDGQQSSTVQEGRKQRARRRTKRKVRALRRVEAEE
jgi:hypothetical protein